MAACVNHPNRMLDYEEVCPLCIGMLETWDVGGTDDRDSQAQDAARYRAIRQYFVREISHDAWFFTAFILRGASFEAALDAAVAREAKEKA